MSAGYGGRGGQYAQTNNSFGVNGQDGAPSYLSFLNSRVEFRAFGGKGGNGGIVGQINSTDDYFSFGGSIPNMMPTPTSIIGGPGGVGRASATYTINNENSANLKMINENPIGGYIKSYISNNELVPPNNQHWLPFSWITGLKFNGNYNVPSPVAPTGGGGGGGFLNTTLLGTSRITSENLNRNLSHAYLGGRGGFHTQNNNGPVSLGGSTYSTGIVDFERPDSVIFYNTIVGVGGNGGSNAPSKIFSPEQGKKYGGGGGGGGASRNSNTVQNGAHGAQGSIIIIEE